MKFPNSYLLTSALLTAISLSSNAYDLRSLPLIPRPQRIFDGGGSCSIDSTTIIILGKNVRKQAGIIPSEINMLLESFGLKSLRVIAEGSRWPRGRYIYFGLREQSKIARNYLNQHSIVFTDAMRDEGYVLRTEDSRVMVISETPQGLFYGCATLLELLRHTEGRDVPSVMILDWPLLKLRGISDDMSRGQVSTLTDMKRIVRQLALLKLNFYSPYIEDIFEFKNHPDIGVARGRISQGEVRELVAFAKQYFVDIVPTFETLGHQENLLLKPQYLKYAEFPGAHAFNVSSEETYVLLRGMIDELVAVFPSKYFNMGADESCDVGRGASAERVQQLGIAKVHAQHYRRVYDVLKRHGKTVLMYGDILLTHPDILPQIPKNIIIVDWQYHADAQYPSAQMFADSGFQFIVSPASWNFVNPFPQYQTAVPNIKNLIRDGYRAGGMGTLNSTWGDYGGETFRELNWYGYAWGAECSWSPEQADYVQFNRKFFSYFFGSGAKEVELAYTILFDPMNMVYWHEIWRHPFLSIREEFVSDTRIHIDVRLQGLRATMPVVLQLVEKARSLVTRNEEHLDYLEFVARLKLWFANKVSTAMEINQLITGSQEKVVSELTEDVRTLMDPVVRMLSELKDRFRALWLRTNKPDNLDLLMRRYNRQIAYWQEKVLEIRSGRTSVDPNIPSLWIYHPATHPAQPDSVQAQHAYFRRHFELSSLPQSALLQLLGETFATVYVNGTSVGQVYATRSLSLTVEYERVKLFDITPYLRKGKNVIAAEVQNFYDEPDRTGAGLNVYAEFTSAGLTDTILTDSSWVVSDTAGAGWTSINYDARAWQAAKSWPSRWPVVRPNFATRRRSWIER
ncbi:MAG: family 20 glycosylhydrolase [Bacteroidota bacterium]